MQGCPPARGTADGVGTRQGPAAKNGKTEAIRSEGPAGRFILLAEEGSGAAGEDEVPLGSSTFL